MKKIIMSRSLKLPIEAVTQTFGFMARKGAGKTYTAGVLAEGLYKNGAQVVILDPVGNWWGLRMAKDGKKKGLDIPIIGGDHGDLPIYPDSGKLLAQVIVEKGISAVLDISEFNKSKFKHFVYEFATHLFSLKKKHRTPIHIIFEEAQLVAPQRVGKDEARMMGAIESLVRLGRNYGIGCSLISQRPQSVHKDVLNQVECLFVGQTNGAHERKAIKEWVVEKDSTAHAALDNLPSLPVGTVYVWSPQWLQMFKRIRIGQKTTYDASSTPTFSSRKTKPVTLKPVDLKGLKKSMEGVIEKNKQDNPVHLRAEVNKLQKENNKLKAKVVKLMSKLPLQQPVPQDIDDKKEKAILAGVNTILKSLGWKTNYHTVHPSGAKIPTNRKASPSVTVDNSGGPSSVTVRLTGGALRMAKVLAQIHPRKVTRVQLGTMAGLKASSGTFSNYMSMLRQEGLFVLDGKLLYASESCVETYSDGEPIPTAPDELLQFWKGKFSGGAVRMLDILSKAGTTGMSREDLAIEAGIVASSGTYSNYISILNSNGLIKKIDYGYIRLVDELIN